jgi:hypothetical protein
MACLPGGSGFDALEELSAVSVTSVREDVLVFVLLLQAAKITALMQIAVNSFR